MIRLWEKAAIAGLMSIISLSTLSSPITTAYASDLKSPWQYIKQDDDNACVDENPQPVNTTSSDQQSTSSEDGDVYTEGTERNKVAHQVFDILTKQYGFSGCAAAGVLSNIQGECGFNPAAAEGVHADSSFGLNSKEPPADFNYGDSGGGGGLLQETPYTLYTNSKFWSEPNSSGGGGWYVENQLAFAWDYAFKGGGSGNSFNTYLPFRCQLYGITCNIKNADEFLAATDAKDASRAWLVGYEGPAKTHPERETWAVSLNAYFNKDNIPADPAKWEANGLHDKGTNNSPNDTAIVSGVATSDTTKKKCATTASEGITTSAKYLDLAKQWAANRDIGYQMGGGHADSYTVGDDLDCSGFVSWVLKKSDNPKLQQFIVSSTSDEAAHLEAVGFTQHDFNVDELQPGDILLVTNSHEHTEIFLGYYDLTKIDADGNPAESTKEAGGTPLSIGAHSNKDGVKGDGHQKGDKQWYDPDFTNDVSAVKISKDWQWYFRPSADLLT